MMSRYRNYIYAATILALLHVAIGVGFGAVLNTGTTDYQGGNLAAVVK